MTPAILFKILIGAASVFALFQLRRVKEKYSRWITIAMVATAIVSILPAGPLSYDGHIAHAVVTFIALVYVFAPRADEPDNTKRRRDIIIMGIAVFVIVAIATGVVLLPSGSHTTEDLQDLSDEDADVPAAPTA